MKVLYLNDVAQASVREWVQLLGGELPTDKQNKQFKNRCFFLTNKSDFPHHVASLQTHHKRLIYKVSHSCSQASWWRRAFHFTEEECGRLLKQLQYFTAILFSQSRHLFPMGSIMTAFIPSVGVVKVAWRVWPPASYTCRCWLICPELDLSGFSYLQCHGTVRTVRRNIGTCCPVSVCRVDELYLVTSEHHHFV